MKQLNTSMIELLANFLQFYNTSLLEDDASNNDLMRELQRQNTEYFEQIIAILKKLEKSIDNLKL